MKPKYAVAVLLACGATAARAQGAPVRPMPAVGELIRVSPAGGEAFTGSLAALGRDTLLLTRPGDTAVMVSLRAQPVDVLRRRRETWSGLGALAGAAAGVLVSQLGRSTGPDASPRNASHAVLGGAAGAVAGGLTGFFVAPRRWQRLTVLGPRMLPPPATLSTDAAASAADPAAASASSSPAPGSSSSASASPSPLPAPPSPAPASVPPRGR
ncbi:hypothetical protein [Longimicrobium sp.]|uniref:hypothetical protein n=1 Tax=Longimicrobium sp. TaxID=2029185 RepID=UPI002CB74BF1|nr:hypothetical protein [Longimicrobium sp.]HSU15176.1 hypothetical protein [Longimicrobium sp.]